jgi:hypothetical protein
MADLDEITGVSYSGGELWTPHDPNRLTHLSDKYQTVFTRSHNDDGAHNSKNGVGLEVAQAYGRYTWTGATYALDASRSRNMNAVQAGDYTATGLLVLRLGITMNSANEWGAMVFPVAYYNRYFDAQLAAVAGGWVVQATMRYAIEDKTYTKTSTLTRIQFFDSTAAKVAPASFGVAVFGVRD